MSYLLLCFLSKKCLKCLNQKFVPERRGFENGMCHIRIAHKVNCILNTVSVAEWKKLCQVEREGLVSNKCLVEQQQMGRLFNELPIDDDSRFFFPPPLTFCVSFGSFSRLVNKVKNVYYLNSIP